VQTVLNNCAMLPNLLDFIKALAAQMQVTQHNSSVMWLLQQPVSHRYMPLRC